MVLSDLVERLHARYASKAKLDATEKKIMEISGENMCARYSAGFAQHLIFSKIVSYGSIVKRKVFEADMAICNEKGLRSVHGDLH